MMPSEKQVQRVIVPLYTPDEFANMMRACHVGDPEGDHSMADKVIMNLLITLGYSEGVKVFDDMVKWYA